jgi:hypothetical protein
MAENTPQIQNLLTFFGSLEFRTRLISRNLKPYVVEEFATLYVSSLVFETITFEFGYSVVI